LAGVCRDNARRSAAVPSHHQRNGHDRRAHLPRSA
jgi:hypothetical protein